MNEVDNLFFNNDNIATYVKGVYILLGQKAMEI